MNEEEISKVWTELNGGDVDKFAWKSLWDISREVDIDSRETDILLRELGRRGLVVSVQPNLWMSRERYKKTAGFVRRLQCALLDRIVP